MRANTVRVICNTLRAFANRDLTRNARKDDWHWSGRTGSSPSLCLQATKRPRPGDWLTSFFRVIDRALKPLLALPTGRAAPGPGASRSRWRATRGELECALERTVCADQGTERAAAQAADQA